MVDLMKKKGNFILSVHRSVLTLCITSSNETCKKERRNKMDSAKAYIYGVDFKEISKLEGERR